MDFGRSNNLSLKYQSFPPSSSRDIGFKKSEFVIKTHFLYKILFVLLFNKVFEKEKKTVFYDIFKAKEEKMKVFIGGGF